jgi:hypothetical protein
MKSYIENIRKSLKKLGYAPTSDQIRHAINIVCPSGVNILESKSAIVDEVVKLLSAPTRYTKSQIVAENSPLRHMPQRGEPPHGSGSPTPQPAEEQETGIVVSEGDKHEVITAAASVYGIELSEVEVLELASNVGDKFTDYMEFVQETKQAIKSYADHRYDSLERQISDTSEDLKTHFEHRERQLNQKLATGLGEINTFFRTQSARRKELSKVIASAFKI